MCALVTIPCFSKRASILRTVDDLLGLVSEVECLEVVESTTTTQAPWCVQQGCEA
jgi:hypothetical protein